MQRKSCFVLGENLMSYSNFFNFLEHNLQSIKYYCDQNNMLNDVQLQLSRPYFKEDTFMIFLIEYPYISQIAKFLENNVDSLNYILISYYNENTPSISGFKNVFDVVNVNSSEFDKMHFFTKLSNETYNKNRISLLQSEVREFYEIGKSLSSEKDTMKLFEKIINSSMKLTSSDAGTLYLVIDEKTGNWSSISNNNYDNKLLKFIIAKNMSIKINLEASTTPITKESIFGYTAITGNSLKINNAYAIDSSFQYKHNHKFDSITGYKTKSILSIPMKDNENNITGVIQLLNKKENNHQIIDYSNINSLENIVCYDFSDELIMNSLASQAAVILANNLLYNNMQKLLESYKSQNKQLSFLSKKILKSNEDERKRIAREIHDGPAQYSSNSLLRLEICKKYLQKGNLNKLESELSNLRDSLKESIKEIRTIIYDLKPSYLESGLFYSVNTHVEKFSNRTGLNIDVYNTGNDSDLEDYMVSAIYRIVQESLTNVHKHAKAQSANVSINIENSKLLLIVSDDGVGFDTAKILSNGNKSEKGGFGLEGIKERVALLSGELSINSEKGKGTKIFIKIPLF